MDSVLIVLGATFAALLTVGLVMGVLLWINRLYERAEEHTRWKNGVSDTLIRIESSCNHLESQARKSEKAKPRAKRK